MRLIPLAMLTTILTACSTTNYYPQALNSWQGGNLETLVRTWGVPDRTMALTNGTAFYVYVNESYQSSAPTLTPGYATYTNSAGKSTMATLMLPTQPTTIVLQCTTWFEVNRQHIIVAAQAKGNYCYADAAQARSLQNPLRPVHIEVQ